MSQRKVEAFWPKPDEEMYPVAPAATRLGIKPKTLRTWMAKGRIGYVRLGNKTVRVPLSEVNRIIAEGYRPAKSA
jgi:excisionase family DNA binding protein